MHRKPCKTKEKCSSKKQQGIRNEAPEFQGASNNRPSCPLFTLFLPLHARSSVYLRRPSTRGAVPTASTYLTSEERQPAHFVWIGDARRVLNRHGEDHEGCTIVDHVHHLFPFGPVSQETILEECEGRSTLHLDPKTRLLLISNMTGCRR